MCPGLSMFYQVERGALRCQFIKVVKHWQMIVLGASTRFPLNF